MHPIDAALAILTTLVFGALIFAIVRSGGGAGLLVMCGLLGVLILVALVGAILNR